MPLVGYFIRIAGLFLVGFTLLSLLKVGEVVTDATDAIIPSVMEAVPERDNPRRRCGQCVMRTHITSGRGRVSLFSIDEVESREV